MAKTAFRFVLLMFLFMLIGCVHQTPYGAQHSYEPPATQSSPLFIAAMSNDIPAVKRLLKSGVSVDSPHINGSTPLMVASEKGHIDLMRLLISKGANINSMNTVGHTPLILAAIQGRADVARLLISKGANPSIKGLSGKTAAEWAQSLNRADTYNAIIKTKQGTASVTEITGFSAKKSKAVYPQQVELKKLITQKDLPGLKIYLDEHPEELSSIHDMKLRLSLTGPSDLRIMDITQLVKGKVSEAKIVEQIMNTGGPYKEFTSKEKAVLRKMSISKKLEAAMIITTIRYDKNNPQTDEQQKTQPNQAMQVQQEAALQPALQQQAPETNSAAECLKLTVALQACGHTPGGFFGQQACKIAARAMFNCPGM